MTEHTIPTRHPLNVIAAKFDPHEALKSPPNKKFSLENQLFEDLADRKQTLCLEPETLTAPALILDHRLRVVWQNDKSQLRIWHLNQPRDDARNPPHLFDLLFDSQFQGVVDNWRHCVIFFLKQCLSFLPMEDLHTILLSRNERECAVLRSLLSNLGARSGHDSSNGCLRQTLADGECMTYRATGTTFDQKRLIVFEPGSDDAVCSSMNDTALLEARKEILEHYSEPVQTSLYVLAARLHDADTLRTEMLDEEYGGLVSRILKTAIETLEQYKGLFCQHTGSGLLGFFLPGDETENNPLQIIQCALDLKARMKELGREWKIRKGWLHDIELNIGISVGNEYLLALPTRLGSNVMPLGSSQAVAICLSDLAVDGQIWITKSLINRIPPQDLKHLRFGLFRGESNRQVFVARCFSRIRDLSDTLHPITNLGSEMGNQAVTQIFDRQAFG